MPHTPRCRMTSLLCLLQSHVGYRQVGYRRCVFNMLVYERCARFSYEVYGLQGTCK